MAPFCTKRGPVEPSGKMLEEEEGGCKKEAATPFCNLVRYPKALRPEHRNVEVAEEGEEGRWGAGMALADYCPTLVTMYRRRCGE